MQSYENCNYRFHTDSVTSTFFDKRKSTYSIFDIFLAKQKCQNPQVAYHLFEIFGWGGIYHIEKVYGSGCQQIPVSLFDQRGSCTTHYFSPRINSHVRMRFQFQ
jgi:hypothetical protein